MNDTSKPRERIAELRRIEAAATPGPLKRDTTRDGHRNQAIESADVVPMDNGRPVASLHITAWKRGSRDARPDAEKMAAAWNSLRALLDVCEAAAEAIEALNHPERFSSVGAFAKLDAALGRVEEK